MKTLKTIAAAILSVILLAGCNGNGNGYDWDHANGNGEMGIAQQNIIETLEDHGRFTMLLESLEAANLTETLESGGPFTIFAPTDQAFARMPEVTLLDLLEPENEESLADILKYHVVAGRFTTTQLVDMPTLMTLSNQLLYITAEEQTYGARSVPTPTWPMRLQINGADVVEPNIQCSNGVIHAISAVLRP